MDQPPDIVAELLAVTRELAGQMETETETFAKLLERRGELMRRLCSGRFDPRDERIVCIVREGAAILAMKCSRRDSLREETASLDLLAVFCGRMRSTLAEPEGESLNVTA